MVVPSLNLQTELRVQSSRNPDAVRVLLWDIFPANLLRYSRPQLPFAADKVLVVLHNLRVIHKYSQHKTPPFDLRVFHSQVAKAP